VKSRMFLSTCELVLYLMTAFIWYSLQERVAWLARQHDILMEDVYKIHSELEHLHHQELG
jgi:hypothetical protein